MPFQLEKVGMDLLKETMRILRAYRIAPKKRLGQNFLVDYDVLKRMVSYAELSPEDTVLEVGAGLGFLTEILAEECGRVLAVEVDPRLVKILKRRLSNRRNLSILKGDILKMEVPPFNKVVSTPPYSISSPLLFWLLDRRFERAILTFQKEFAERLVAPVNSRGYCRLTVTVYYKAKVKILDYVPRDRFWPTPDVDSLIIELTPRKEPPFKVEDENFFFNVVRFLFTQKNKKLRNGLIAFLRGRGVEKPEAVKTAEAVPFHQRRVRELTPEDLGLVVNELARRTRGMGLL